MKFHLALFLTILHFLQDGHCSTDTKNAVTTIKDFENSTLIPSEPSKSSENFQLNSSSLENNPIREKWKNMKNVIEQMTLNMVKDILPFILKAAESLNISARCPQHLMMTLRGIKETKLWAFRMIDSSGKIPNGLLWGTTTSYGNFDECLAIDVKHHFRGRYCSITLKPPLPPRAPLTSNLSPVPELQNLSSPDTVMGFLASISRLFYAGDLRTSACVPSSCSRTDVESIFKKVIEISGMELEVAVPNCETKESLPLSWREITALSALGFVLLLTAAGTITDIAKNLSQKEKSTQNASGLGLRILLCFSVYSNTKKLLKVDISQESITVFRGMKVLTMLWILFIHTYALPNVSLIMDSFLQLPTFLGDIAFEIILNGYLSVETFFFMSAVVLIYGRMKSSEKQFTIELYIFRRLWRLTPPILFLIACTLLIPRLGSGPVWKEVVGIHAETCKYYWWKNLLYINNYGPIEKMCIPWLWYVAVDTQLYMLAFFAALPIKHHPRIGFLIIAVIFAGGILWLALSNLAHNIFPVGIFAILSPEEVLHFLRYGYFKAFQHASAYCIGMVVGYILATRQKFKISSFVNVVGWSLSILLGLIILYCTYEWQQGIIPTMAVATFYACIHRVIFAMCLAWVTISCFTGNGGIISSILGWSAFVPLSRLTYTAYLVHPLIQYMYYGSMRSLLQFGHRSLVYTYLGHTVMTYMVAYAFSMLFECPFMGLEKVMIPRSKPKEQEDICMETKIEFNGNFVSKQVATNEETTVYTMNVKSKEVE